MAAQNTSLPALTKYLDCVAQSDRDPDSDCPVRSDPPLVAY